MVHARCVPVEGVLVVRRSLEDDVRWLVEPGAPVLPLVLRFVPEFAQQPVPERDRGVEVAGAEFDVVEHPGDIGIRLRVTHTGASTRTLKEISAFVRTLNYSRLDSMDERRITGVIVSTALAAAPLVRSL